MSDERLADIKGALVSIVAAVPQGYGDGSLVNINDAKRIASYILEDFFLVPINETPDMFIEKDPLSSEAAWVYSNGCITDQDKLENLFDGILATVANYQAGVEIHRLTEERDEQDRKDNEFAFTLFKTLDPSNLHYTSWSHLPRLDQQRWLNVARKAREELKDNK